MKMNKQRETVKQNTHRRPDYYRSQKHLFSWLEQTNGARLQRGKLKKRYSVLKQLSKTNKQKDNNG